MLQIGIDIGHGRLKVVGLHELFGRWSLVGTATVGIPTGALTQTGLTNAKELGEALKIALHEARPHRLRGRQVISALPANVILTKLLELPPMSPAELARALPFEASQAFPVPSEDLIIDWHILKNEIPPKPSPKNPAPENTSDTEVKNQEILLVGAPKALVTGMVELFESLDLQLVALEIKPLANVRATGSPKEAGASLLLDIGGEDTSLVAIVDGQIRHISTLKFGADGLTRSAPISKVKAKKATKAVNEPITLDLLAPQIAPLADEINHVAKYTEQRLAIGSKIRRVRLCGGGANIPRLTGLLEKHTNLQTELANPLRHIRQTNSINNDQTLSLTTAIGLALRQGK